MLVDHMLHIKKNGTDLWRVFLIVLLAQLRHKLKGFSKNRKASSKEVEGVFQRVVGSCTHKFPKCGLALLMDLPELHCIFRSFVYNSDKSGFHKCTTFFGMHTLHTWSMH